MADIVPFTPRADARAAENVKAFVTLARSRLTVFGAGLDFDADVWDVTESVHRRGAITQRKRVTFCTLGSTKASTKVPLGDPFGLFAKAYIRYMQGANPITGQQNRLGALRALEAALAENGQAPDVTAVRADHLDHAAQLVKQHFSEGAGYRIGGQLEEIARFLSEHGMVGAPVAGWASPLPRPQGIDRIGEEFQNRRAEKLPSAAALDALPKVFHLAADPVDRIVTSIAAILLSAPDRSIEVLTLPEDCEVRMPKEDGAEAYGLRWWPAKGAEPTIKWVVPSMAGIVQQAVARLRETTAEARRIAAWYERHPDALFLPPGTEHLRGAQFLTAADVQDIIGLATPDGARQWCDQNGVPLNRQGAEIRYRFADVEQAMVRLLPDGFPVFDPGTGLRYSEALMVIPRNGMHAQRSSFRCMIEAVTLQHLNNGLGTGVKHGKESVFSRFGFAEEDGSPIRITSHMFRHYLNTLAQAGGLSELDIAKWSGRNDVRQNAAYDHVSAEELLERVRARMGEEFKASSDLTKPPEMRVITKAKLREMLTPTAHITELGICIHDFAMLPCPQFLDCVNCDENCYVKGDRKREKNLREKLELDRALLKGAVAGAEAGEYGADRWVGSHAKTVARLESLCAIFDDPSVPDGTVIRLADDGTVSKIRAAMDERDALEGVAPEALEEPDVMPSLPTAHEVEGSHG